LQKQLTNAIVAGRPASRSNQMATKYPMSLKDRYPNGELSPSAAITNNPIISTIAKRLQKGFSSKESVLAF